MKIHTQVLLRAALLLPIVTSTFGAKSVPKLVPPAAIDIAWASVPTNYRPSNPETVRRWVESVIDAAPGIDAFTGSEQRLARDQYIEDEISKLGIIGIETVPQFEKSDFRQPACRLDYFPADSRLTFGFTLDRYSESSHSTQPTDRQAKAMLSSATSSGGAFVGSNAFGATTEVSKFDFIDYSVAVAAPADFTARTSGYASLSPADARDLVPNLKCFVLLRPHTPFLHTGYRTSAATLSRPTQVTTREIVFFGRVEGVWLVDHRTGKIVGRRP